MSNTLTASRDEAAIKQKQKQKQNVVTHHERDGKVVVMEEKKKPPCICVGDTACIALVWCEKGKCRMKQLQKQFARTE